ncbi:MAG: hypothetical protein RLZZ245_563, partial [Verrucomicrobiota bacterium]
DEHGRKFRATPSADILSATVRATSCRPNSKKQTADKISANRQRAACTRSFGQIPSPLFLGDLGALAVQTSSSSPPRSADILSATVRATSCRPNSKEQNADRISANRQRAACTRPFGQIPFPHSSLASLAPWRSKPLHLRQPGLSSGAAWRRRWRLEYLGLGGGRKRLRRGERQRRARREGFLA